jgi:predicted nucleic acid-binding protein
MSMLVDNIVVDSSVWIDFFRGEDTWQAKFLRNNLGEMHLIIGDIILLEIMRGIKHEKDYRAIASFFSHYAIHTMLGAQMTHVCAQHYRTLRQRGVTIRKTADMIIGSYCIHHGHVLLHHDRDFEPMSDYLGLKTLNQPRSF